MRDRASYVVEQNDIRFVLTSGLAPGHRGTRLLRPRRRGQGHRARGADAREGVPRHRPAGRDAACRAARGGGRVRRAPLAAIATYGDTIHSFVDRADYAGPSCPDSRRAKTVRAGPSPLGDRPRRRERRARPHEQLGRGTTRADGLHPADPLRRRGHLHRVLGAHVQGDEGRRGARSSSRSTSRPRASGRARSRSTSTSTGGPGVQHIALATDEHRRDREALQDRGIPFLAVAARLLRELAERVGKIDENFADLRQLGILADRDEEGYLLQIFTKTAQDRPTLFFEVIQRKGAAASGRGTSRPSSRRSSGNRRCAATCNPEILRLPGSGKAGRPSMTRHNVSAVAVLDRHEDDVLPDHGLRYSSPRALLAGADAVLTTDRRWQAISPRVRVIG